MGSACRIDFNPCSSSPDLLALAEGESYCAAVVLVGSRKDSETYVRSKKKACAEVGFESFGTDLPEDVTQEEVLQIVANYNADSRVRDGGVNATGL